MSTDIYEALCAEDIFEIDISVYDALRLLVQALAQPSAIGPKDVPPPSCDSSAPLAIFSRFDIFLVLLYKRFFLIILSADQVLPQLIRKGGRVSIKNRHRISLSARRTTGPGGGPLKIYTYIQS